MGLPNAPKVMAMHDLCSYGRSSLNVVVPILAATNCHCCSLPTALLSSHFGFKNTTPSLLDLSQELINIYEKWNEMNLHFDAFYSGYLASPEQVLIAKKFIDRFNPEFIYIDPVLGDNGTLYPAFNHKQVKAMRLLMQNAYVSSPNLTEANALLELPLKHSFPTSNAKDYLRSLSRLGPKIIIVTGIQDPDKGRVTSYLYNKEEELFFKVHAKLYLNVSKGLHGTGDSFASIVTGKMLSSRAKPQEAVASAMHYLSKTIEGAIRFNEEIAIEYALEDLFQSYTMAEIEVF